MLRLANYIATRAGVVPGYERDYMVYWWQQFLISGAWGFVFPIRSVYLYEHGMSLSFYGAVGAVGSALVLLTQGYLGRLSDRLEKRVAFMIGALSVMAPITALIPLVNDVRLLALLQVLDILSVSTFFTMTNAIVSSYSAHGRAGSGLSICRMAGSVGWVLATFSLGFVVGEMGMRGSHFVAAGLMVGVLLFTLRYAAEPPFEREPAATPSLALAKNSKGAARYRLPAIFIALLLAMAAVNFAQSAGFTYRSIFFKHVIGTTDVQLGWVMSLQAILEVPFMLWLGSLSDSWGRRPLLALGFLVAGLRWWLLSYITFPMLLFPLQVLHAMGYTSTAVIVLAYVSDLVPRRHRGVAMGMLNAAQSLGAVAAPLVAGYLAEAYGLRIVLRVAALAAVAGTTIFLVSDAWTWLRRVAAKTKWGPQPAKDRDPLASPELEQE